MPAYTSKSPTVAAKQFNQFASDTKHEHLVRATGRGKHWGMEQPLTEIPKGLEAFGYTTWAVKDPITKELTEVNDTDWIVHTTDGHVIVVPDSLFKQLYGKVNE